MMNLMTLSNEQLWSRLCAAEIECEAADRWVRHGRYPAAAAARLESFKRMVGEMEEEARRRGIATPHPRAS